MGIVNVTPDSFSDGGAHFTPDAAVAHALKLLSEGADMIDVGGESTRPGTNAGKENPSVVSDEELRRVLPVIAGIKKGRSRGNCFSRHLQSGGCQGRGRGGSGNRQ